jgi:hypothetical protein
VHQSSWRRLPDRSRCRASSRPGHIASLGDHRGAQRSHAEPAGHPRRGRLSWSDARRFWAGRAAIDNSTMAVFVGDARAAQPFGGLDEAT